MDLDVQTVSIVIASIGVVSGAIYYIMNIRHERRLRQTESLIRLSPWFNLNAKEMQEIVAKVCSIEYGNYHDYLEKYSDKPEHVMVKILGNYFEGIGILVAKKLVEVELVHDFWGDIIQSSWEHIKPMVAEMRKETDQPNMFKFWEYLYDEMKEREQRH